MDHHSIIFAPTQLELVMEGATWKIMMWLATMMEVIVAPMLIKLEMGYVMKTTKTKSVTLIGWIAAYQPNDSDFCL